MTFPIALPAHHGFRCSFDSSCLVHRSRSRLPSLGERQWMSSNDQGMRSGEVHIHQKPSLCVWKSKDIWEESNFEREASVGSISVLGWFPWGAWACVTRIRWCSMILLFVWVARAALSYRNIIGDTGNFKSSSSTLKSLEEEFLVWYCGLRIWHCCSCGTGHRCS